MKNLLKYLFPIIAALAFCHGAKGGSSISQENIPADVRNELTATQNPGISAPEADFCLPRQVSSVNAPRLQNNCRRSETTHRQNITFIKSGKTINSCLSYIVQEQSIFHHSPLIRPSSRLLYLGQLII